MKYLLFCVSLFITGCAIQKGDMAPLTLDNACKREIEQGKDLSGQCVDQITCRGKFYKKDCEDVIGAVVIQR